ncbi:hypothetical protein SCHPADRAFT_901710 [Schizopora paradoxa]|uniref:Uncharacterized protein n=1 Tax=Schizopora paradoxa TaxID=27342 RepID=A0A0H2RX32_9AGAM|nr:hypothetical protein SCHPADRAFT_901710 [Schizopora paradoxa]
MPIVVTRISTIIGAWTLDIITLHICFATPPVPIKRWSNIRRRTNRNTTYPRGSLV